MTDSEKSKPIGLSVLFVREDSSLTISKVNFSTISVSGIWDTRDFPNENLSFTLMHHLAIGRSSDVKAAEKIFGGRFASTSPEDFQSSTIRAFGEIEVELKKYLEVNPKKASSIAPLPELNWLELPDSFSPIEALKKIGKSPFVQDAPEDMKEPLAMARLVRHLVSNWVEVETQRVSRKYLSTFTKMQNPYPSDLIIRK